MKPTQNTISPHADVKAACLALIDVMREHGMSEFSFGTEGIEIHCHAATSLQTERSRLEDTASSNLAPTDTDDSDSEDSSILTNFGSTNGDNFGEDESTDSTELSPEAWTGDDGQFNGAGASGEF